jgi:hypothetical protein
MSRCAASGGRWLCAVVLLGAVSGCVNGIPEAAYRLPPSTLGARDAQTRTFEATDEAQILQASVALLQDMEYNLDTIEYPLGVLSASKVVDADSASQKAGLLLADILLGSLAALGGGSPSGSAYAGADDEFELKITLVVLPSLAKEGAHTARITLQQRLIDKSDRIKEMGVIEDPEVYQEIFAKLSQSLYLEGAEQ